MTEFDHHPLALCKRQRERPENSGLEGDLYLHLCDADAGLYQLSYQASWEHVIMWVDHKPIDVEIHDNNTGIFNVLYLNWVSTSTAYNRPKQ